MGFEKSVKCVDGFCIEHHKNKRVRSQRLTLVWKAGERSPVEKGMEGEVLSWNGWPCSHPHLCSAPLVFACPTECLWVAAQAWLPGLVQAGRRRRKAVMHCRLEGGVSAGMGCPQRPVSSSLELSWGVPSVLLSKVQRPGGAIAVGDSSGLLARGWLLGGGSSPGKQEFRAARRKQKVRTFFVILCPPLPAEAKCNLIISGVFLLSPMTISALLGSNLQSCSRSSSIPWCLSSWLPLWGRGFLWPLWGCTTVWV